LAEVAPFRGLHYNPAKVAHFEEVVTPPYDVISPKEREAYGARHPFNMVHLILPQALPGDNLLNNRYTRAGALFRQWQRDGVLLRDPEPAFYYWETEFPHQGRTFTRRGLAALVRLEPLSSGIIKPHEQTFSAIKADRLELLKHSQAHFSPIFVLFPDKERLVLEEMRQDLPPEPLMAFRDSEGNWQRLFRVTSPPVLNSTHQAMLTWPLYIADGHHRYETALAYQKWLKQTYPPASPRAGFNYVLMYLANMYDPELVILMAHRLLGGPRLKHLDKDWLLGRLSEFFELTELSGSDPAAADYAAFLQESLDAAAGAQETTMLLQGFGQCRRLELRPGVRPRLLARQMHPALAQLDVAVLNFLIFEKILGLDAKAQDDPQTCKYTSKIPEALAALSRGDARLAFFLNPTRIEQVQEVAAAGLIMPRKSTFFYPKVPTGMILNPINPQEEIVLPDPSAK
jgi:uncharacterized protein (DUF1015 family)